MAVINLKKKAKRAGSADTVLKQWDTHTIRYLFYAAVDENKDQDSLRSNIGFGAKKKDTQINRLNNK